MSEFPESSIDLLVEAVADDEGIGVTVHSRDEATLSLPVVHATGKVIRYSIAVKPKGNELEASESKDEHQLPRFWIWTSTRPVGKPGFSRQRQ